MTKTVLLTGSTGFVGVHLLLELLLQTDSIIYCLVRDTPPGADERLHSLVADTIGKAQYPIALLEQAKSRVKVVVGDLTSDLASMSSLLPDSIDSVWHCAASLNYEDKYAVQISAINVDGTAKAIALARSKGVVDFNYISTAYVAGKSSGLVLERPSEGVTHSNFYENSKAQAEALVLSASNSMAVRILRPSIVIGHSETFNAFNFSGLYGFMRILLQMKSALKRAYKDSNTFPQLTICADPSTPLNLVPVDRVAREAVRIACSSSGESFFHLTQPNAPTVGEVIHAMFDVCSVRAPVFTRSADGLSALDQKFNSRIDFYSSYLSGHKIFDRTHTDAALGPLSDSTGTPMSKVVVEQHCRWFLGQLGSKSLS